MDTINFDVGEQPKIAINSVGGDLRLTAREGATFEARAPERGELKGKQEGDRIVIECRSSCLVFLPAESQVDIESVGGDGRITGIKGDLLIKAIGGDLSLRRVGQVAINQVGGDLAARRIDGAMSVDTVGGDVSVEKTSEDLRIRAIGGDLRIKEAQGLIDASVGGDAQLDIAPSPGTKSAISAGGDLTCRLPQDSSARVNLQAAGDIVLSVSGQIERDESSAVIEIGNCEADISLQAGGDLVMRDGTHKEDFSASLDEAFLSDADAIIAEVDSKISEIEARLGAIGAGAGTVDAERIGAQVRRAVSKAIRKSTKAGRHAKTKKLNIQYDGPEIGMFSKPSKRDGITDEERLSILKMVEKGTISVDQAEDLMQSLGSEQ